MTVATPSMFSRLYPPFAPPLFSRCSLLSVSLAVTLKELEALLRPDSREVGVTLPMNIEVAHHATGLQDVSPASA